MKSLITFSGESSRRALRRSPVSTRRLIWALLAFGVSLVLRAEPASRMVDLSGAGETDFSRGSTPALPEGDWRGYVDFAGRPTEFAIEVDHRRGETKVVQLKSAQGSVARTALLREKDNVVIPIDARTGERLVGRVSGETFVGHYFVGDGESGASRVFPFRAQRQPHAEAALLSPRNDLTGEWVITFGGETGSSQMVRALVGHGARKLYVIWRNSDGTKRYLMGEMEGVRFVLKEISRGPDLVFGRLNPASGMLSGEIVEASTRVAFTAIRRPTARPLYAMQVR